MQDIGYVLEQLLRDGFVRSRNGRIPSEDGTKTPAYLIKQNGRQGPVEIYRYNRSSELYVYDGTDEK